jgi:aminoglycoside phosphotransferase
MLRSDQRRAMNSDPIGHADRMVTLDPRAGVALKRYQRADGARVYNEMTALWQSPFGITRGLMPEPRRFDEADNTLHSTLIDGTPLGARGNIGRTHEMIDSVAELLYRLHSSGVSVARSRTRRRVIRSLERKAASMPSAFVDAINELTDAADRDELLVVCHGDFSPLNVLETATGLVLIDFDRLQMSSPARDIDYLGAWCWITDLMNHRQADWHVGDSVAAAYRHHAPDAEASTPFHRAAALLRAAAEWSAMKRDRELQRLVVGEALRQARI